ncbi:MAG: 30S ribosomal protein S5 [candidate division WS6 bacterium GW2011_GWF2_39_15]|uniref:Small ribosomal subunit protein uS5 n=1 Tax=candidate division WS6 bacterium GW2011_GWF2_39_15 TaxID=1619100 RepID=A0A0G0QVL8_9BACT|nr:MAG: 30S ribosomal protein S5 [candidate division WS6 bacterium GW2011_GWF2_39_15]
MENRRHEQKNYEKKAVTIRRVAKVTAGGKRLRFSAMVVAGDKNGSVGIALGRGVDTRSAMEKAERRAAKNMKKIQVIGDTIPHEIRMKHGAAQVLLRPAKPGAGIIAGSASRTVLEMAGIQNVYCKQLGSNDIISNTYCTFNALMALRKDRVLKRMRIMQERIGLKEKMDEERKAQEAKRRKSQKNTGRDSRDNRGNNRGGGRGNNRNNINTNRNAVRKTTTKKK